MPTVHISETFDLSTKANKLGLIGVHTPPRSLVELHYGPLMNNYRKIRFLGCDIVLACASTLPLDPLQVGVSSANYVHPADAMNPILYKAVSNDSFETIVAKMKGATPVLPSSNGSSINRVEGADAGDLDDFDIYYGLLSNSGGWRKSMPQTGLVMRNVQPLMYPLLSDIGNTIMSSSGNIVQDSIILPTADVTQYQGIGRIARGKAQRAPALSLWQGLSGTTVTGINPIASTFPTTYVAGIIVPPCHSSGWLMFYRLRITWHIRFEGLVSYQDHSSFATYAWNGAATQWEDYSVAKDFEKDESTVSTNGFDLEKVM